jgi:hypothetical protein
LRAKSQRDSDAEKKLKSRPGQFALKIFPVTKIALDRDSNVVLVESTDIQPAEFSQIEVVAGGLCVILQVETYLCSNDSILKKDPLDLANLSGT